MDQPIRAFGQYEAEDWVFTQRMDTLKAYRRYLEVYPDGKHQAEAYHRFRQLKEEKDWLTASKRHRAFAYELYLESYPDGKYALQAAERLATLEHELAWHLACQQNNVAGFLAYKRAYPAGSYVAEAVRRVTQLVKVKSNPSAQVPEPVPTHEIEGEDEELALEAATSRDTVAAYNAFLKAFPDGQYQAQVRERIRQLERKLAKDYEALETEVQAWQYASQLDSLFAYRDFLTRFPKGRFAPLAQSHLARKEQRVAHRLQRAQSIRQSEKATITPTSVRQAQLPKGSVRDAQSWYLSLFWISGFGFISLLAYWLAPFLYPLCLMLGVVIGVLLLQRRGQAVKRAEAWVYVLGFGAATLFPIKHLLALFLATSAYTWIVAAFFSLMVMGGLLRYFLSINRQKALSSFSATQAASATSTE